MSVTVLVVDDHPLVRSGFRFLAESRSEIELVAEAGTAAEAIVEARRNKPDVVIMDIELGDGSGIDATRRIRAENPGVRVLVVTMHDDEATVLAALRAGANGYVLKGAHQDELVRAIEGAAAGELVLGSAAAGVIMSRIGDLEPIRSRFPSLTGREHEVLELLAAGRPNGNIAAALGVSRKTVANHVANILTKMHVVDRGEAIVVARQAGYGRS